MSKYRIVSGCLALLVAIILGWPSNGFAWEQGRGHGGRSHEGRGERGHGRDDDDDWFDDDRFDDDRDWSRGNQRGRGWQPGWGAMAGLEGLVQVLDQGYRYHDVPGYRYDPGFGQGWVPVPVPVWDPYGPLPPQAGWGGVQIIPPSQSTFYRPNSLTTTTRDRMDFSRVLPGAGQGPVSPQWSAPGMPTTAPFREYAHQAFAAGDYVAAARWSTHAMVDAPGDAELGLFAAHCQFAIGEYSAAADLLATSLETLPPQFWGGVPANFRAFYGQNDYVPQLAALEQEVGRPSARPSSAALLGYHYLFLGYRAQAQGMFERALAVEPENRLAARLLPIASTVEAVNSPVQTPAPQPPLPGSSPTGSSTMEPAPVGPTSAAPPAGVLPVPPTAEEIPIR